MQRFQEQCVDDYSLNSTDDELEAPETPEDVAVLYTWANVHGGKYRDFSASRREFRAQQRHRMMEQQREAELEAARAREEVAAQEMEEVRRLEEQSRHDEELRLEADEARCRAQEIIEQERLAAQHHVEVAEELKQAVDEAKREMEAARGRAEEQAARYAEADARYRASAQQVLPGEINDPYYYAGPLEATAFAPGKGVRSSVPQRVSSEKRIAETYYRSKGGSDAAPVRGDASRDEQNYGFFASGQRPRGSSASRPAYTETSSGTPHDAPDVAEARPETAEEYIERQRPDEVTRLADQAQGQGYRGNVDDDGYYDGIPVHAERSSDPAALNSAPSNVYLPPRVQQAADPPPRPREEQKGVHEVSSRTREDGRRIRQQMPSAHDEGTQGVSERAQDPVPGSPHMLDQSRAHRRESSADVAARTTRRPRVSGVWPSADTREGIRVVGSKVTDASVKEAGLQIGGQQLAVSRSSAEKLIASRAGREAEGRPEWLVRQSAITERDGEHRRVLERSRDEATMLEDPRPSGSRDAKRSGAHMIPAADGGFNLPPLTGKTSGQRGIAQSASVVASTPPAPRIAEHREPMANTSNNEPSAVFSGTASVAVPEERTTPDAVVSPDQIWSRPAGERRRYDRGADDRLTRELRVPQSVPVPSIRVEQEPRERRIPSETDMRTKAAHPADTLQQSRERVAARWFALKGLMSSGNDSSPEVAVAARTRDAVVPILAVVSLSGGVGKTSVVATVGRVLSSLGERVLLADATPFGLLPYYFGARELRPNVVRTFSPPPGSKDAPVFMVNYETDRLSQDEEGQTALLEEIRRHAKGTGRMLLDLNASSTWLARRLAGMDSTILVPIAADMNSVLGIKSLERVFAGLHGSDGRPQMPHYILNQFDASQPLHLDVREVLRQQLGERLLPVVIRRSPSVAEALAEGMTVMDYVPGSPVTEDYAQLAEWVRKQSAPAQTTLRSTRWSER